MNGMQFDPRYGWEWPGRAYEHDPSTIVDLTGPIPRLLRLGAIPEDKIRAVVGILLTEEDEAEADEAVSLTKEAPPAERPSLTKDE